MIKPKDFFTKNDVILITAVLSIGFLLLGIRHLTGITDGYSAVHAEITFKFGVESVYLDTDRIFYIDMVPNVLFEVRDGQIAFIISDCPDQICVHTGFISRAGQMAACLPNGLIMLITNTESPDDELDIFVR